jgi:hypothetical protein
MQTCKLNFNFLFKRNYFWLKKHNLLFWNIIYFRANDSEDNSTVKNKLNNMKNQQAISSSDLYGGNDYGKIFIFL